KLALITGILFLPFRAVLPQDPDPLPGLPSVEVGVTVESGPVENTAQSLTLIFTSTIEVPDAEWLRINVAKARLSGAPDRHDGSLITITSLKDGAFQELDGYQV